MNLAALSKLIQDDVEEVLALAASFKEALINEGKSTQEKIERLEASAREARSKIPSNEWFQSKPLEMRSKRAQELIQLRFEQTSNFVIQEKTDMALTQLAPVGKCFRFLNGNKGRSNIDEYLHSSIKNSLLSLEDSSNESFDSRMQRLSQTRFLLLTK